MSSPLISIILCSFNGEKFIEAQLNSLLNQTYPNLEIIISDDASTDATFRLLKAYERDQRLKLFSQPHNLGQSKNVDFAIKKSLGEFIAFSDQDDVWLPQKIEKLYSATGDGHLVYCDSELIDEKGGRLNKKISELRNMYTGDETTGFLFSNVVWGHAMLISKNILPFILPIPSEIPYDIWIAFRAAATGGIKYLDIPLTLYRQHESATTRTIAVKTQPRSMSRRYADFQKQLHWIKLMRNEERPEKKFFYDRLFGLYKKKEKGKYVWPLLFFLLKHKKKLFAFTKKKSTSQVIEIFKQAKGEKHE